MRGARPILVAVALVAAGCSVDLGVQVTDAHGNPTVVPLNAESVSITEEAAPATSAAGDIDAEVVAAEDDDAPSATPAESDEDRQADATSTPVPPTPNADTAPEDDPSEAAPEGGDEDAGATGEDREDGEAEPDEQDEVATATPLPSGPPPVEDATPTPTPAVPPTPAPIEFVVAADAPLLGVSLGTDATVAMDALEATIGAPDYDSGWYVGCPLDGDAEDERLVQWGDLNVYFDRSDGPEVMRAWGYDLRIVDGGFPEIELIQLPGGTRLGDPVNEVAAAAGLDVRFDELFEINRVGEPGYEILADAPPGAPVWGAFVPGIPTCE